MNAGREKEEYWAKFMWAEMSTKKFLGQNPG
jgi:hypothetical protein